MITTFQDVLRYFAVMNRFLTTRNVVSITQLGLIQ